MDIIHYFHYHAKTRFCVCILYRNTRISSARFAEFVGTVFRVCLTGSGKKWMLSTS